MSRKTLCLNMIVKNEALVIRRCLSTVRHLIDAWAIVDTGSTDGTQQIIRDELAGIPGELYERPWKNFGHNRTEARELARRHGDYLLLMDADDQLETDPGFELPPLVCDGYESAVMYGGLLFYRINVINSSLPWRFVGVLHEYLACDQPISRGRIEGMRTRIIGGGARSQVDLREKFLRDAALLEAELEREPDNARNVFYLAQSYRDAGDNERALAAYDRRATMGGFDQEVFRAQLEAARCCDRLNRPAAEVIERYLRAHECRPSRAEPLGELAAYCRTHGERWPLAKLFAKAASELPLSSDSLFVEHGWYEWQSLDELSIADYWTGDYQACIQICERLLNNPHLPEEHRDRVLANLNFARGKLGLPEVASASGPVGGAPGDALDPATHGVSAPAAGRAPLESYGACPLCHGKAEVPLAASTGQSSAAPGSVGSGAAAPGSAGSGSASSWLRCEKCGHVHAREHWAPKDLSALLEQRFAPVTTPAAAKAERRRWAPAVQAALTALGGFETMVAEDPPWAWLDVHPSGPGLLDTAQEFGFQTAAVVEKVERLAPLLPGAKLVGGGWAKLPPALKYRAISLCDVLDRLAFPLKALRAVRDALEPGGVCVLTCPNSDAASFRLLGEREQEQHRAVLGRHHLFSVAGLIDLLNTLEMPVVHFDIFPEGQGEVLLVARKLGVDGTA